jgi:hypothetical protein
MDLIEELRDEHKNILKMFDQLDWTIDSNEIKKLAAQLLEVIVPHVNKEDIQLYPPLRNSASAEISQTAGIFSGLMVRYSMEIVEVIKTIINWPGELTPEVSANFSKIRARIRDRIAIEEAMLFSAYKEIK